MDGQVSQVGARVDGRVLRGQETRRAILRRAVDIGSVEGLDGLSIGRLAGELAVSKSGVFAHFGSKEELQLSTVRAAAAIFRDRVIAPACAVPPGIARVWQLSDEWLTYATGHVFAGGCFFTSVSAEFATRPGRVRDAIAEALRRWQQAREQTIENAIQLGEIRAGTDVRQLAFELKALEQAANSEGLLHDDPDAYVRARRAMLTRLRAVATDPRALPAA